MNDHILELFLETLIPVVVPVIAGFIAYLLKSLFDQFKLYLAQKGLTAQYEFAMALIQEFIRAAEQNGLTGELEAVGARKKQWVMDMVQIELAKNGIHLDVETLSALVEAAVYDAFQEQEWSLKLDGEN